jgi:hypothetical protein
MSRDSGAGRSFGRGMATYLAAAAVLAAAILLSGCDVTASGPLSASPVTAPVAPVSNTAQGAPGSALTSASVNTTACTACTNTANATLGTVEMVGGVQVLKVSAYGETYSPNLFNVKAGVPVRMEFSGKPVGCFKHPTFKWLKTSINISSGSGSIDLGPLQPGSYVWTSALNVGPGTIVAE